MPSKAESLTALHRTVLGCREMGHAWDIAMGHDTKITESRGRVIEFTRFTACWRCGAARTQVIEVPSFQVKRSSISYPDDYLLPVHPSKGEVRREVLHRIIGERK